MDGLNLPMIWAGLLAGALTSTPTLAGAQDAIQSGLALIPEGMEGTWAPVKEEARIAWYFNGNYPWLGMLFCAPIIGLWYWCTDQYIVQRALGAPNEREARRGTLFAAFLKLLPVFIFIIPGMIAFALAKSGMVPALQSEIIDPATGEVIRENAQAAYPLLVQNVLPVGFRGIVVAGLLAVPASIDLAGADLELAQRDVYRIAEDTLSGGLVPICGLTDSELDNIEAARRSLDKLLAMEENKDETLYRWAATLRKELE